MGKLGLKETFNDFIDQVYFLSYAYEATDRTTFTPW